jgi:hypothetical protein
MGEDKRKEKLIVYEKEKRRKGMEESEFEEKKRT